MAVRVRARIRNELSGKEVESVALLNAGYETPEPELILPVRTAELLGLWPSLPAGSRVESYRTVSGEARLIKTPTKCIEVIFFDKRVKCYATISEYEDEVIFNDKLTGMLEVIFEDVGRGLWRKRGEEVARESESPQYW